MTRLEFIEGLLAGDPDCIQARIEHREARLRTRECLKPRKFRKEMRRWSKALPLRLKRTRHQVRGSHRELHDYDL